MTEKDVMNKLWETHRLYDIATTYIHTLLARGKVRLSDVPYDIRISAEEIYLGAIPTSMLVSCERFVEDLQLMAEDIATMPDDRDTAHSVASMKECLLTRMNDFLQNYPYYDGVDEFELAKESIRKKLQL